MVHFLLSSHSGAEGFAAVGFGGGCFGGLGADGGFEVGALGAFEVGSSFGVEASVRGLIFFFDAFEQVGVFGGQRCDHGFVLLVSYPCWCVNFVFLMGVDGG